MLQLDPFRWDFFDEAIEVLSIKNVSLVSKDDIASQVVLKLLTIQFNEKFFHLSIAQFHSVKSLSVSAWKQNLIAKFSRNRRI